MDTKLILMLLVLAITYIVFKYGYKKGVKKSESNIKDRLNNERLETVKEIYETRLKQEMPGEVQEFYDYAFFASCKNAKDNELNNLIRSFRTKKFAIELAGDDFISWLSENDSLALQFDKDNDQKNAFKVWYCQFAIILVYGYEIEKLNTLPIQEIIAINDSFKIREYIDKYLLNENIKNAVCKVIKKKMLEQEMSSVNEEDLSILQE